MTLVRPENVASGTPVPLGCEQYADCPPGSLLHARPRYPVGPPAGSGDAHPLTTAVSLFAGIEGFGLALERAGIQVVAAVEIDPDCREIIRRRFPQVTLFNDVTEVTADELIATGFVPYRSILTGGFPCQDISVAGRRAGLGGARSGLFWHIMRLADALHPRWLVLENVPGLLSSVCPCPGDGVCVGNGRAVRCGEWQRVAPPDDGLGCPVCGCEWAVHDAGGYCAGPCGGTCDPAAQPGQPAAVKVFVPNVPHGIKGGACPGGCMADHGGAMGTVLGALAERGYGFAYRVLDAQYFGVPQRRQRVFIVGCLGDRAAPVEVLLEPDRSARDPATRGEAAADIAGASRAGAGSSGGSVAGTLGSRQGGSRTTDLDGHGAYITGALGTMGPGGGWRVGADEAAVNQLVPHRRAHSLDQGVSLSVTSSQQRLDGTVETLVATTLQGGGRRGHRIDAEGAAGGHLVPVPLDLRNAARDSEAGDTAGTGVGEAGDPSFTLSATSRALPGVAVPVALRGRDAGNQAEAGEPGDPSYAVRTPGGGSSYPMVAAPLTRGSATGNGVNPPGRRQEDDINLVAQTVTGTVTHALTSEGGDASEDGTGRGTPLIAFANTGGDTNLGLGTDGGRMAPAITGRKGDPGNVAMGVAENQRGEVLETTYSHQLTTGGGKPGQGYPAVRQ